MPGYRQILSNKAERDYTIDNKRIYDRHLKALKANDSALSIRFSMDSRVPMQDIVPVDSEVD